MDAYSKQLSAVAVANASWIYISYSSNNLSIFNSESASLQISKHNFAIWRIDIFPFWSNKSSIF
ncbi:hypothetical protein HanPSC8_Chr03g0087861 [Helianthus annuus]|nr:hypothetical protein HanPSC8_Chr03g0087861 [Helianthus annuus]